MRSAFFILTASAAVSALSGLSAQQTGGCPDIDKAARSYLETNFPGEDEQKPPTIEHKIFRIAPHVSALQFSPPAEGEDNTAPRPVFVAFFSGTVRCAFVQQWDGEIAETIEAGATKFVIVRTEDAQEQESHADFQVITVTPQGEVVATQDQHGQEIHFSQTMQKRCGENFTGDIASWKADSTDARAVTVRQRHTDRDARCRITEDSSSYRYYRLTPERWELDDTGPETTISETEAVPATAPVVHSQPPALPRR